MNKVTNIGKGSLRINVTGMKSLELKAGASHTFMNAKEMAAYKPGLDNFKDQCAWSDADAAPAPMPIQAAPAAAKPAPMPTPAAPANVKPAPMPAVAKAEDKEPKHEEK